MILRHDKTITQRHPTIKKGKPIGIKPLKHLNINVYCHYTTRYYFIVMVILKVTFLVLGFFKGCKGVSRADVVPVVFAVDLML